MLFKNKLCISSFFLSVIVIICVIIINVNILDDYNNVDGKTKAFYDAVVFSKYSFKHYLIIVSLVSLILIRLGFKNKEKRFHVKLSIILLIMSSISIFFNFWKLFI